jgi:hypothetical protein
MTTWYELETADEKLLQRIMDAFMPKYIGSGRPLGMALFSCKSDNSNTIKVYFAPKAVSLAMQFGATSHDGNFANQDLSLLVGDEGSIDYLFPELDSQ